MMSSEPIPPAILKRKAVVYVRKSSQSQVQTNLESKRRQYDLVDVARQRGFVDVDVIDDDLGRSASGTVARPGFDRLVAWLCAGKVGAVLCFDASRLARNGRDWHHLLELCGLVEARVIDLDGVYNPCRPNDRLLLGMKGSISEFELGVLRARMLDAARSKAGRGELRISVPFGYIWHRDVGLGLDPDRRLQEVIRLIFARFRVLGSAHQVLLSMTADGIHFPRPSDEGRMTSFEWMPIRYRNVIAILKNPFYAGVYVYGKSEKRTALVDGRARRSYGHSKPIGTWEVMIRDHHEGYISWEEYERNQKQLALNDYRRAGGVKSGRGGEGAAVGDDDLWAMRTSPQRHVYGQSAKPTGVSLRQTQPYDGAATVHDLRRPAGRCCHCPGALAGCGTDGDRSSVRGRADTVATGAAIGTRIQHSLRTGIWGGAAASAQAVPSQVQIGGTQPTIPSFDRADMRPRVGTHRV